MDIALSFTDTTDTSTDEQAVVDAAKAFLKSLPPTVTVTAAEFDGPTLGAVNLLPAPPAPTVDDAAAELLAAIAALPASNPDGTFTISADEAKALQKASADLTAALAAVPVASTPAPAPAAPAAPSSDATAAPADAAAAPLPTTGAGDTVAL